MPAQAPWCLQETITRAQEEAEAIEAGAQGSEGETLRWAPRGVSAARRYRAARRARARFSDLVVLPQPYGEGRAPSSNR